MCGGYASDGTDPRNTPSFLTKANQRVDRMGDILHDKQVRVSQRVIYFGHNERKILNILIHDSPGPSIM